MGDIMLATELIKRLQELVEKHGDLPVELFADVPVRSVVFGSYDLRPEHKVFLIE